MSEYSYGDWNYTHGAQTATISETGYYLAECWNVNNEASNKNLPISITSTGETIFTLDKRNAYNASALDVRDLHYSAAIFKFDAEGTVSFDCSGTTGSYTAQLYTIIKLPYEPENLTIEYFQSGSDNNTITQNHNLNLSETSFGKCLVQFLEMRRNSIAVPTISISTPAESTPLTFSNDGAANCRIAGAFCELDGNLALTSTNSGGNSYASKIYTILFIPGVTGYTVVFNANGGTGSMVNQNIAYDTPTALNPNTFTRFGKRFIGWATSPNGEVTYTDEEVVENIAGGEPTITLYAVWTTDSTVEINIAYNASDVIKADKDVTNILTVTGVFKSNTSIIDPTFIIECDPVDVSQANYMSIPIFRRSYFITNFTVINSRLVEIVGHVDVLSSFKTGWRANTGIIKRSDNSDLYNLLLNDGALKSYQDPYILTKPFPAGFEGYAFVLAVTGS